MRRVLVYYTVHKFCNPYGITGEKNVRYVFINIMMNDVEKKTSCRNKYQNIESIVAKEEFLLQADDFAIGNACMYFGVNYVENSLEIWKINYHKSRGSFVTNRLLHTFRIHIL